MTGAAVVVDLAGANVNSAVATQALVVAGTWKANRNLRQAQSKFAQRRGFGAVSVGSAGAHRPVAAPAEALVVGVAWKADEALGQAEFAGLQVAELKRTTVILGVARAGPVGARAGEALVVGATAKADASLGEAGPGDVHAKGVAAATIVVRSTGAEVVEALIALAPVVGRAGKVQRGFRNASSGQRVTERFAAAVGVQRASTEAQDTDIGGAFARGQARASQGLVRGEALLDADSIVFAGGTERTLGLVLANLAADFQRQAQTHNADSVGGALGRWAARGGRAGTTVVWAGLTIFTRRSRAGAVTTAFHDALAAIIGTALARLLGAALVVATGLWAFSTVAGTFQTVFARTADAVVAVITDPAVRGAGITVFVAIANTIGAVLRWTDTAILFAAVTCFGGNALVVATVLHASTAVELTFVAVLARNSVAKVVAAPRTAAAVRSTVTAVFVRIAGAVSVALVALPAVFAAGITRLVVRADTVLAYPLATAILGADEATLAKCNIAFSVFAGIQTGTAAIDLTTPAVLANVRVADTVAAGFGWA